MKKLLFASLVLASSFAITIPSYAMVSNNLGSIVNVSGSCQSIINEVNNNSGSIVKVSGDGTCNIKELTDSGSIYNNRGSIIIIDGVCGDAPVGSVANNKGSIVKIESNGACDTTTDTSTATHNVEVTNNSGSIVNISDDSDSVKVTDNRGSIIKVVGSTTTPKSETPKPETPKNEAPKPETPKSQAPAEEEKPADKPADVTQPTTQAPSQEAGDTLGAVVELPSTGMGGLATIMAQLSAVSVTAYGVVRLLQKR